MLPYLLLGLLALPAWAEPIHRWTDADGTVHFADKSQAPAGSQPLTLRPGTYLPPPPKTTPAPAAQPPALTLPPNARNKPCTEVEERVQDPRTGFHETRRYCAEDRPEPEAAGYRRWRHPCGPAWGWPCLRPPPLPPPRPRPRPPGNVPPSITGDGFKPLNGP